MLLKGYETLEYNDSKWSAASTRTLCRARTRRPLVPSSTRPFFLLSFLVLPHPPVPCERRSDLLPCSVFVCDSAAVTPPRTHTHTQRFSAPVLINHMQLIFQTSWGHEGTLRMAMSLSSVWRSFRVPEGWEMVAVVLQGVPGVLVGVWSWSVRKFWESTMGGWYSRGPWVVLGILLNRPPGLQDSRTRGPYGGAEESPQYLLVLQPDWSRQVFYSWLSHWLVQVVMLSCLHGGGPLLWVRGQRSEP